MLRQGQRNAFGRGAFGLHESGRGSAGRDHTVGAALFDQLCELGGTLLLEDVAQTDGCAEGIGESGGEPRCAQRVAALLEEGRRCADPFGADRVGEHAGDDLLQRRPRRDERLFGSLPELGFGQSLSVHLAVRVQRQGIEDHDGLGDHVVGQHLAERGPDLAGIEVGRACDVGREPAVG